MRVGGQFHAPAALLPGKRPGSNCIGVWVGSMAGLDGCGKSRPHRDSIPGPYDQTLGEGAENIKETGRGYLKSNEPCQDVF
jgi:hypothetical protein